MFLIIILKGNNSYENKKLSSGFIFRLVNLSVSELLIIFRNQIPSVSKDAICRMFNSQWASYWLYISELHIITYYFIKVIYRLSLKKEKAVYKIKWYL